MPGRIQLDLALAGIALARKWLVGDREAIERIQREVRRLVQEHPDDWKDVPLRSVADGYAEWAAGYDQPGNPILQLEGPFTQELFSALQRGSAVDAACGTGRQSAVLAALGHDVVGVDGTPAMLEEARRRVPEAEFRLGLLAELPVDDESMDLAVCSLALTHLEDPAPAFAELARVVRPGGRIVTSDVHPLLVSLGSQAAYRVDEEVAGFVVNNVHFPSVYLRAFRSTGLEVRECHELLYTHEEVALWAPRIDLDSEVAAAALVGLPAVLVWDLERV